MAAIAAGSFVVREHLEDLVKPIDNDNDLDIPCIELIDDIEIVWLKNRAFAICCIAISVISVIAQFLKFVTYGLIGGLVTCRNENYRIFSGSAVDFATSIGSLLLSLRQFCWQEAKNNSEHCRKLKNFANFAFNDFKNSYRTDGTPDYWKLDDSFSNFKTRYFSIILGTPADNAVEFPEL